MLLAAITAARSRRAGGPGPRPSSGGRRRTLSPGHAEGGTGASPGRAGTDRADRVYLTMRGKGRVESGVNFVQVSFFAGEQFTDLADARARGLTWCTQRAGQRVHGTTRKRPAAGDRKSTR